jgi:hypothetical protein
VIDEGRNVGRSTSSDASWPLCIEFLLSSYEVETLE